MGPPIEGPGTDDVPEAPEPAVSTEVAETKEPIVPEKAAAPAAGGEEPEQEQEPAKAKAEEAPAEPEAPPKPELYAGDRVVIEGMVEKAKLNGASGILVAMTGDRWQVRLDGKGRWLMKTEYLKKVEKDVVDLRKSKIGLAGTFDDWKQIHDMTWDETCKCFVFEIKLGDDKEESFQILLDNDWKRCMHPDKNDATPYSAYNLLGPDQDGHGKNWTIGKHMCDGAAVGNRYRVSLSLLDDGSAKKVNWTKIEEGGAAKAAGAKPAEAAATEEQAKPGAAAAPTEEAAAEAAPAAQLPRYQSVTIVGEFNDFKAPGVPMKWDEARRCFHHRLKLGYTKQESFQILVDGEWSKCVHPDEPDGCFRMGSIACGPDDDGHGKDWRIGIHPYDAPARGAEYEVRLVLKDDGTPDAVDWYRVDKNGQREPEPFPAPAKLPEHKGMSIIGSWKDWKEEQMKWDADRRCYHIVMEVGPEQQESFQFWLNGESKKCLHPAVEDGSPFTDNRICGPDNKGHGKNWTIGQHPLERAACGTRFEVALFLTEDGAARLVDWQRIRPGVVGRKPR